MEMKHHGRRFGFKKPMDQSISFGEEHALLLLSQPAGGTDAESLRESSLCVRQLLRAPTFTIVTILTLTLGGANTAIFSVVQAILLHPAGVDDPERVVSVPARYAHIDVPTTGVSAPDLVDAASLNTIVESAAMSQLNSFNATLGGQTRHISVLTFAAQQIKAYAFSAMDVHLPNDRSA
jgi:hypothetical protein